VCFVSYILIADIVARARDEDGMRVLPVFVHGPIEDLGKSGRLVMRGRPVDGAGKPGAEVNIPASDWRRMRFPIASATHPHDTFWNDTRQLAYVDVRADAAALRPKSREQSEHPSPVGDAVRRWFNDLPAHERGRTPYYLTGRYRNRGEPNPERRPGSERQVRKVITALKNGG
jgi:hypothetical protein